MATTLSSSLEYQSPYRPYKSQDPFSAVPPDRYEQYVPSSLTSQHDYQILEQVSQYSSSGDEGDDKEEPQQHIYQVLEQPGTPRAGGGGGGGKRGSQGTAKHVYQSLQDNTKADTHFYQSSDNTLRPREGEGSHTTPASALNNSNERAGYASVVTTNTNSSMGTGGGGQSSNHRMEEVPMQIIPSRNGQDSLTPSHHDKTKNSKNHHRTFKIIIFVCWTLLLLAAVILSTVALVVALAGSPSPSCQCSQQELDDIYSRIEQNSEEIQSLSGSLDSVQSTAAQSGEVTAKNEGDIAGQRADIELVKDATLLLSSNISALEGEVTRLSDTINNVNCSTNVEASCTFNSLCSTQAVDYRKPGTTTLNFNCLVIRDSPFGANSDVAATAMWQQNGRLVCQCSSRVVLSGISRQCGLLVTRCSTP